MSKYLTLSLEEVHSTNSYALENLSMLEDKTVVYTLHQTSGRGRFDRKWVADDTENLYMSIVLKPDDISNFPISSLTQYLSVIVCECLEKDFSLNPQIKWPNDILVEGGKISGILAEASFKDNKINGIVLGIGLNINLKQETINNIDQKVTSLSVLKGENFDVKQVLDRICNLFFDRYDEFVSGKFVSIKDEYVNRCGFLGKKIFIREFGGKNQYLAKSIDEEGFLIAEDVEGKECKIMTGDVLC